MCQLLRLVRDSVSAEMVGAEAINFMAKHGRGLICLALEQSRVQALDLPLMTQHNSSRHQTAFTISIEAREGVTTGISAADRALTVATAIDPTKSKADIATPGHIFPLAARDGGVLVRAGHTEAAVDIARLAGLNASGVICEVMNDDGTMARLPDLEKFAEEHNLKIAKIADLIAYRSREEKLVKRLVEGSITSQFGGKFKTIVYVNTVAYAEHIALIKGDISADTPTLVRMHALDVLDDVLGEKPSMLHTSMQKIADAGTGVIVLLREPRRANLSDTLRRRNAEPVAATNHLRTYGIGAQILKDLGVKDMTLLSNNPRPIVGLDAYGLNIVGYEPIQLNEAAA